MLIRVETGPCFVPGLSHVVAPGPGFGVILWQMATRLEIGAPRPTAHRHTPTGPAGVQYSTRVHSYSMAGGLWALGLPRARPLFRASSLSSFLLMLMLMLLPLVVRRLRARRPGLWRCAARLAAPVLGPSRRLAFPQFRTRILF